MPIYRAASLLCCSVRILPASGIPGKSVIRSWSSIGSPSIAKMGSSRADSSAAMVSRLVYSLISLLVAEMGRAGLTEQPLDALVAGIEAQGLGQSRLGLGLALVIGVSMVISMTEQLFSQRVIDDKSYVHALARAGIVPVADDELPPEVTYAVVRTMVAAALADGHLAPEEKAIIQKHLGESGLSEAQTAQVHQDLVLPPGPAELAALAGDAEAQPHRRRGQRHDHAVAAGQPGRTEQAHQQRQTLLRGVVLQIAQPVIDTVQQLSTLIDQTFRKQHTQRCRCGNLTVRLDQSALARKKCLQDEVPYPLVGNQTIRLTGDHHLECLALIIDLGPVCTTQTGE